MKYVFNNFFLLSSKNEKDLSYFYYINIYYQYNPIPPFNSTKLDLFNIKI